MGEENGNGDHVTPDWLVDLQAFGESLAVQAEAIALRGSDPLCAFIASIGAHGRYALSHYGPELSRAVLWMLAAKATGTEFDTAVKLGYVDHNHRLVNHFHSCIAAAKPEVLEAAETLSEMF